MQKHSVELARLNNTYLDWQDFNGEIGRISVERLTLIGVDLMTGRIREEDSVNV